MLHTKCSKCGNPLGVDQLGTELKTCMICGTEVGKKISFGHYQRKTLVVLIAIALFASSYYFDRFRDIQFRAILEQEQSAAQVQSDPEVRELSGAFSGDLHGGLWRRSLTLTYEFNLGTRGNKGIGELRDVDLTVKLTSRKRADFQEKTLSLPRWQRGQTFVLEGFDSARIEPNDVVMEISGSAKSGDHLVRLSGVHSNF